VLIELLTIAVAGQLHRTGKELIRVHPTGGTAVPGEEHLVKWKVSYECWPAPDTSPTQSERAVPLQRGGRLAV
jgi:hypothetical protein